MKQVDLVGVQLDPEGGVSVVLLREQDEPHRVLPLFVGTPEASSIALGATGVEASRPLTHDVMATLVERLGAQLDRVEVTTLDDATFHADLVMVQPDGDLRVDTRPSDAIALAVRTDAPLYVSEEVLDEAGAEITDDDLEQPVLDAEAIEAEVDEFRGFLAELEPADFGDTDVDDPEVDDPEVDDAAGRDEPTALDD